MVKYLQKFVKDNVTGYIQKYHNISRAMVHKRFLLPKMSLIFNQRMLT